MLTNGDISLYFHIPFCSKKCPYCHFFVVKDNALLRKKFLTALKREWLKKKPLLFGKNIVSIYFGGGTPSLLTFEEFREIFSWFDFDLKNCEITLEANPEHMQHLKNLKSLGINRLSIGVQSLDDPLLKTIGRNHDAKKALDAIYFAASLGFDNISIDLMYDLPNQTLTSFESTLKQAIELPITHLSLYNLTIEENSAFFKQKELLKKRMPKDEESFQLLNLAIHYLEQKFIRYEISAFSKAGYQSYHNSGYWTGRPFLGYGPSAFSYFNNSRFSNVCNILDYERREDPIDFQEVLDKEEGYNEWLAIRLRYFEPFYAPHYPPSLKEHGFIQEVEDKISLTHKGILFYDTVAEMIV